MAGEALGSQANQLVVGVRGVVPGRLLRDGQQSKEGPRALSRYRGQVANDIRRSHEVHGSVFLPTPDRSPRTTPTRRPREGSSTGLAAPFGKWSAPLSLDTLAARVDGSA